MFNLTVPLLINILLLYEKCRENDGSEMTHGGIFYKCRIEGYRKLAIVDFNGTTQSGTVCLCRGGTVLATTKFPCLMNYMHFYDIFENSAENGIEEDERLLYLLNAVHLDFERVHIQNDLLQQLPNLRRLGVIYSNSSVIPDVISGLKDLQTLQLANSPMRTIPADFFRSQQELVYLNYSFSALEVVGDETFKNMSFLKTLALTHNQLVDISGGSFATLINVEHLTVSNNRLTTLPQNLLGSLSRLKSLDLSNNKLRSIPAGIFHNNSLLRSLYLNNNQLVDISGEVFIGQTELQSLTLNNNKLNSLPTNLLSNLHKLLALELDGNELSTLPGRLFANSSGLRILDLGNNRLVNVTDETFSALTNIGYLYLDRNRLSSLPDNFLVKSPYIRILDLSHNMLRALPAGLFENTSMLMDFYAAHNRISDLPRSLFPSSLQTLDLSHNLLKISPFISAFKETEHSIALESVSLRNNSISSVVDSQPLSLGRLDLSHNNITELSWLHWLEAPKGSLNFSSNQITHINCNNCTQYFKELLLNHNPIICDFHLMDLLKEIQLNQAKRVVEGTCAEPVQYRGENISSVKKLDVPLTKGCPKKCICSELVLPIRQVEVNCTAKDLMELPDILQLSKSYEKIIVIASHNRISSITHNSLRGYENVSWLDVGHNHLKEIAASNMTKLEYIDMSFNDLHDLHSIQQFMDRNAIVINAAGNPWDCECSATIGFFSSINANTTIADMDQVRCSTGEQLNSSVFGYICQDHKGGILLVTISVILLVATIAALVGYILRNKIDLKPLETDPKQRSSILLQNEVPMGYTPSSAATAGGVGCTEKSRNAEN